MYLHCDSSASGHMATVEGRRASDWSHSTEQEDEGRDGSSGYRSAAGTQGDEPVFLFLLTVNISVQFGALLMGGVFSGCWREDDGVWASLCVHHQGKERKSGRHRGTPEAR